MYVCHVCHHVTQPRQPLLRFTVLRPGPCGPQIAREIPVCSGCSSRLASGTTLAELIEEKAYCRKPVPAPPVYAPPSPETSSKVVLLPGRPIVTKPQN